MTEALRIALVGNPNCGKTSFFNFASGLSNNSQKKSLDLSVSFGSNLFISMSESKSDSK